jgi:hypothetical protein
MPNRNGDYVEYREALALLTETARLLAKMNRLYQRDEISVFLQRLHNEHHVENL